jgi:hypothetical protein
MLEMGGLADDASLSSDVSNWLRVASAILAAVATLVVVWGALTLAIGLGDLGVPRRVQGVVVRRREFKRDDAVDYFLAVDDGRAAGVRAWLVGGDTYARVLQGEEVVATVSPRLGYVSSIEVVAASAASAAAGAGDTDASLLAVAGEPHANTES